MNFVPVADHLSHFQKAANPHRGPTRDNSETSTSSEELPLFGQDRSTENGGSTISYGLLQPPSSETIFKRLKREITWQHMLHKTGTVPRLVCCQGSIDADGSMPVYRHPSDQTMLVQAWTPGVNEVRQAAEEAVGHRLNHALIQLYRSGSDYISEHSDKTLDIVKHSYIVNASFGAQRTMRLRTKKDVTGNAAAKPASRTTYRIPLPHNSMVKMSLDTNAEYLHAVNADKRPAVELIDAEKAFDGERISITFRDIGTFLNVDCSRIWGCGATKTTKRQASAVINADKAESERLLRAFAAENQACMLQRDSIYGAGFDVLHLS